MQTITFRQGHKHSPDHFLGWVKAYPDYAQRLMGTDARCRYEGDSLVLEFPEETWEQTNARLYRLTARPATVGPPHGE